MSYNEDRMREIAKGFGRPFHTGEAIEMFYGGDDRFSPKAKKNTVQRALSMLERDGEIVAHREGRARGTKDSWMVWEWII